MPVVKNLLTKSHRMGNYQQPLPLADDPFLKLFQIITYLHTLFLEFIDYFWIVRSYQRLIPFVGVCGVHFML